MSKIKKIVLSALLLAMTIVLSRFLSINTALLVIGFSFVPVAIAGRLLGPKYSAIISGLSDLIGALIFPFGTYFIGFTISAILKGAIYGIVLYKGGEELSNKELIIRLIIASLLVIGIVDLVINAVWLMIMYDKAFFAVISARIVAQSIMLPIQIITLFILIKAINPVVKKYLVE